MSIEKLEIVRESHNFICWINTITRTTTARSTKMTEESPRKRARLCEDEVDNLCKPEVQEHIKKQEEYISELETRLELSAPSSSNNGDGEDKIRHLKAARREQLLVMRLTTKEQELHELANQLADKTQNASTAQLRSATVDPALNLLVQRLNKELEDKTTSLKQAHEDMAAWKFTPDSQTGKRLMARCRTLIQENQELGKQVSQGKVAQVEAELALQKEINEELKSSQDEMYEMVIQLNDEGEGMQSTILALQQELKEKQQEIARLTYAAESAGILLTPDSTAADMKHEPQIEDNGEQNMQTENPPNMQVNREGKHVEPCKELIEHEEEEEEEAAVGSQIPDVRTTEYSDDETPMDVMSPQEPGPTENKSLSVEPWCNPSHFVESPASPVDDVTTGEEPIVADTPSQDTCQTTSKFEEREIPEYQGGNSPVTTDSDGQLLIEDQPSEQEQEQHTEYTEIEKDEREEESQVRTPLDESSQGSLPSEDDRDIDAVSSRTGERSSEDDRDIDAVSSRTSDRSRTMTPDFSTNGDESHPEPFLNTVQNNGKESNPGRLGENDNDLSTLVRDPSTFEAVIEREVGNSLNDQSDITDKQSDITDKQSDETTTDNNNGLSNPGDGSVSSPQAEHNCASDEELPRTENVIKSLNSNSYSNSPNERIQSEQCEEIPSTTNSNPEEISV